MTAAFHSDSVTKFEILKEIDVTQSIVLDISKYYFNPFIVTPI
jgi:hypothetical protein